MAIWLRKFTDSIYKAVDARDPMDDILNFLPYGETRFLGAVSHSKHSQLYLHGEIGKQRHSCATRSGIVGKQRYVLISATS